MCKFKIPEDSIFNKKKTKRSIAWVVGIGTIALLTWFLPEYVDEPLKFKDMHPDDLKKNYVKINSIDFLCTTGKEKHTDLASIMPNYCKDDVLFGFQFSKDNRTITDHLFMLCESKKIIANAEIVYSDTNYVMCNEQFADISKKIKRSSKVIVKAIDIENWDVLEYESSSTKEACILQHAIDVLNTRWV